MAAPSLAVAAYPVTNRYFILQCFGQRICPADAQISLIDGDFVRCAEAHCERAPGGFLSRPQTVMVDLLAEHDLERYAREDASLRSADVYRLGIRLPRRREKLFTRKWSFDPCRLARALVPAATISQPLQLRCHTGTLLLFQSLRVRLRVLLLLGKVVRLLPHRSWLLRLGRIAALSPVKAAADFMSRRH